MEAGLHELTAGYALDALDPDERVAYEAHLAGCEQCQDDLRDFLRTTEALAVGASGPAPSPGLRNRIVAEIRSESRQNVVALESRPRRRLVPVLAAATAIAAVVAVALGVRAAHLSGELGDARSALEQAQASSAVLGDPAARRVPLQPGAEAKGELVVGSDGKAVLVVDDLGRAPAGKTYQLWIVAGGKAESAGLFPGGSGRDVLVVDGTVQPGDVVAVTVEDAGGAVAPTTTPIVGTQPV